MNNPQQLTFPWSAKPKFIFRDFYINKNNLDLVNNLKDKDAGDIIILGKSHSGKTHLLQSLCNYYNEMNKSSFYLPITKAIEYDSSVLDSINEMDLICIDDIDFLAQNNEWERAIFNLINQSQQTSSRIIFSSSQPLMDAAFDLQDLLSRLNKLLIYNLINLQNEDINDAIDIIVKHNSINIGKKEIQYILNHTKRDIAHLKELLIEVDGLSLATKKKITIPLIKEII